jgi:hypothetical protein
MVAMIAKITPCHGSISPLFDQSTISRRGVPQELESQPAAWHYPREAMGKALLTSTGFLSPLQLGSICLNLDRSRPPSGQVPGRLSRNFCMRLSRGTFGARLPA